MTYNLKLEKIKYLNELLNNQIKNINPNRRMIYKDLGRITKYINSSIFDKDKCCIWDGYVTNSQNSKKGAYINFFFRNKKVALHRLLYENFIGELTDDYYVKFSCENEENKGKCCNVSHMIKYKYNSIIEEKIDVNNCDDNNENSENIVVKKICKTGKYSRRKRHTILTTDLEDCTICFE
jgi:hypothetical protein